MAAALLWDAASNQVPECFLKFKHIYQSITCEFLQNDTIDDLVYLNQLNASGKFEIPVEVWKRMSDKTSSQLMKRYGEVLSDHLYRYLLRIWEKEHISQTCMLDVHPQEREDTTAAIIWLLPSYGIQPLIKLQSVFTMLLRSMRKCLMQALSQDIKLAG